MFQKNELLLHILSFFILLSVFSCKIPEQLSTPKDFKYHTKGLYMECKFGYSNKTGEIITANENEVTLLLQNGRMVIIPRDTIDAFEVVVALTSNEPKKTGDKGELGLIPILGHGWWMIFTIPINALGNSALRSEAATYRMEYPTSIGWDSLPKFARYPLGLPEGLNLFDVK